LFKNLRGTYNTFKLSQSITAQTKTFTIFKESHLFKNASNFLTRIEIWNALV